MNYKKLIVESGKRMIESGLTVETWGNISARDTETGLIYVTPTGMPYDIITEEDVVVVDKDMNIVEGDKAPTIEVGFHVAIMNKRPDVNAIIHTHPVESQVFATLHQDIPAIIDEAAQAFGGPVRCAEYGLPGSEELKNNVIEALGDGFGCLLANHGSLCVGKDMEQAFKRGKVLEMTAEIYRKALSIGTPAPISDEQIAFMKDFCDNVYGKVNMK